jgi:hypothetical protein
MIYYIPMIMVSYSYLDYRSNIFMQDTIIYEQSKYFKNNLRGYYKKNLNFKEEKFLDDIDVGE